VAPVAANLGATRAAVVALKGRLDAVRAGFVALPRLDADDGLEPEPVDHAPLPDL
jgi:hypothetical protein